MTMTDLWDFISLILNLLLGSGGVWLWRETRRIKKAEAVHAETNNAILAGNEWKEIAEKRENEVERLNRLLDERWADKAKDRDTIFKLLEEKHDYSIQLQIANFKLCNRRGCLDREPQTGF